MWAKTLTGVFLGLILTMSVCAAIGQFVSDGMDIYLFITYSCGFVIWTGYMSWIYTRNSLKKPLIISLTVLVCSATVNALFFARILG